MGSHLPAAKKLPVKPNWQVLCQAVLDGKAMCAYRDCDGECTTSNVYCVQGFWRKVTIDDSLPYLDKGEMAGQASDERLIPLYPRTGQPGEIWPALLMKALLKVAALE